MSSSGSVAVHMSDSDSLALTWVSGPAFTDGGLLVAGWMVMVTSSCDDATPSLTVRRKTMV